MDISTAQSHARLSRMARFVLVCIGSMIGLVLPASPSTAAEDSEVLKSLVRIQTDWSGSIKFRFGDKTFNMGSETATHCTGAFVGTDGSILTAGHCVDPVIGKEQLKQALLDDLSVEIPELTNDSLNMMYETMQVVPASFERTVYAYQPRGMADSVLDWDGLIVEVASFKPLERGDFALLRLNNFSEVTPALPLAALPPEIGDRVRAIGFAGSVSATNDNSRQMPSFKAGEVSSFQTSNQGVPFVEVDASFTKGMSGGPTVNENNEVLGVVSWGPYGETSDFNFITDAERTHAFIRGHGVELAPVVTTPTPTETATTSETSPTESASAAPEDSQGTPQSVSKEADDSSSALLYVVVAVAAILLLVVVLLVLALLKNRRKPQSPAPSQG